MTDPTTPYIVRKPGDLITADDDLRLQLLIKEDIANRVAAAVDGVKKDGVSKAEDAAKLAGLTPDALAAQILDYVQRQLPKRTGYLNVFRRLESGEDKESVIEHKLGTWPLVSVFQLDYFKVVAAEDGHVFDPLATFYLYHKSESRIRFRPENANPTDPFTSVEIDPPGRPYRIPWKHMLELYGVAMPDDATLNEVESEFWEKFNAPPNDRFNDDQYFHSPWFDRCCGERRTVRQLYRDWDDIYFQMRPRQTLNVAHDAADQNSPFPAPSKVRVVQYDLQSVGLTLLGEPEVPADHPKDHVKVLVLLKV
jgi:hypothetical protein